MIIVGPFQLNYVTLFYSILVKLIGMFWVKFLYIYIVILPESQREASGQPIERSAEERVEIDSRLQNLI